MAKNGQIWPNMAKNAIFGDFWDFLHFFMYNSAQKAPKMHFKGSIFQVNYKNDKKCANSS